MSNSFYIVSKPLQYFNAININDIANNKTCLIIDNFYQAEVFFENIRNNCYWDEVLFFGSNASAYKWLKNRIKFRDNLFIDSDYGLQKTLWLYRIKSRNIYVYEEGIATYQNDLLTTGPRGKILNCVLRFFGVKEYMGGGPFTKGIIIYDVEKHKELVNCFKKNRLQFKLSFQMHLISEPVKNSFNFDSLNLILKNILNKKVFIYLTGFEYNNKVDLLFTHYSEYIKILKPHPHIKDVVNKNNFDVMIDNSVFIELFIKLAIESANKLILVHDNSSVVQYLELSNNLTLIDLSKF